MEGAGNGSRPNFPEVHFVQDLPLGAHLVDESDRLPGFFEAEDLPYAPLRKCAGCRGCQDCRLAIENLTPQQRQVVDWMEAHMSLDKELNRITCAYPFNGKEKLQVSNYAQALAFQKSVERKLKMLSLGRTSQKVTLKILRMTS